MQQHQGGSISMCLPPWQPNRFPGGHKSDSDLFRAVSNQVLPSNHCAHRVLRQNVSSINYLKAYLLQCIATHNGVLTALFKADLAVAV